MSYYKCKTKTIKHKITKKNQRLALTQWMMPTSRVVWRLLQSLASRVRKPRCWWGWYKMRGCLWLAKLSKAPIAWYSSGTHLQRSLTQSNSSRPLGKEDKTTLRRAVDTRWWVSPNMWLEQLNVLTITRAWCLRWPLVLAVPYRGDTATLWCHYIERVLC